MRTQFSFKRAALFLLLAASAYANKDQNETVTITSVPPGATVEIDRRIVGVTPLTIKYGDYAFNTNKTTLFSKRLSAPVTVRVSMEGYFGKEQVITKEYQWWSMNRQNSYIFHVITSNAFHFDLDKVAVKRKSLTNSDIMELTNLGFSDALITDRIADSPAGFSLELPDLLALREKGVSEDVIRAMFKAK